MNLRIIDLDVIDGMIERNNDDGLSRLEGLSREFVRHLRTAYDAAYQTIREYADSKSNITIEEIWNAAREEHLYDPDDIDSFTIPKYETLNDYLQSLNKQNP